MSHERSAEERAARAEEFTAAWMAAKRSLHVPKLKHWLLPGKGLDVAPKAGKAAEADDGR